jgi:hypothetical protein
MAAGRNEACGSTESPAAPGLLQQRRTEGGYSSMMESNGQASALTSHIRDKV